MYLSALIALAGLTVSVEAPKPIEVPVRIAVTSGGETRAAAGLHATFDVPRAAWEVGAEADGWFIPSRNGFGDDTIVLRAWPAGWVAGRVSVAADAITLRFQPSEGGEPAGNIECPVRERAFRCALPAGTFDVSYRVRGHATEFRWRQTIAEKLNDVGTIAFRPGASLIGFVSAGGAAVTITPVTFDASVDREEQRGMFRRTVTANEKGFFHFEELTAGAFQVTAKSGTAVSLPVEVTILPAMEARLRDPLVVAEPIRVAVAVTPPVDPWGAPWRVQLDAVDERRQRAQTVHAAEAERDGTWEARGLVPGEYSITVGRANRGTWLAQPLTVGTVPVDLALEIPIVKVMGRLTVGGEPAEGTLWFGGEHGAPSIPVTTGADGTFRAMLPAQERWRELDVVVDRTRVRRTLRGIRLTRRDDERFHRLDIDLPGGFLTGLVVDEENRPVAEASVTVRADGEAPIQMRGDESGAFDLHGLDDGEYVVTAEARGASSEPQRVRVAGDAFVRMVLHASRRIRGTVLSSHGPIFGARVYVVPDGRPSTIVPVATDGRGEFAYEIPRTPRAHFAVQPPGYAFRLLALSDDAIAQPRIAVSTRGGTLRCTAAASERPTIHRADAALWLQFAAEWSGGNIRATGDGVRYEVENLEEGAYRICAASRCKDAYVAAQQVSEIDLR